MSFSYPLQTGSRCQIRPPFWLGHFIKFSLALSTKHCEGYTCAAAELTSATGRGIWMLYKYFYADCMAPGQGREKMSRRPGDWQSGRLGSRDMVVPRASRGWGLVGLSLGQVGVVEIAGRALPCPIRAQKDGLHCTVSPHCHG